MVKLFLDDFQLFKCVILPNTNILSNIILFTKPAKCVAKLFLDDFQNIRWVIITVSVNMPRAWKNWTKLTEPHNLSRNSPNTKNRLMKLLKSDPEPGQLVMVLEISTKLHAT